MDRHLRVVLCAIAAAVVFPHHARGAEPKEKPVPRFVLANGMTVLLAEDHQAPVVGFDLRYAAGLKDAPPDRPGLTTLAVRLMVQASKHVPDGDYDRQLDTAGAADQFWQIHPDRTDFKVTVPSDRIALPLWLWSDQMGFSCEGIDDKRIAQQTTTLANARGPAVDNKPAGRVFELVMGEVYPPGHPYRNLAVNPVDSLSGITPGEVCGFLRTRFTPDRAILAISGDFQSSRALALVKRYFETIPPAEHPFQSQGSRPVLAGQTVLDIAAHVEGARVTMAWSTPPFYTDGDAELDVIAQLLAGHRASWLRWELGDRLHIAASVSAHQASRVLGSTFTIDATATQGHTARELCDAIDRVLVRLQSGAPDAYVFRAAVADQVIEPLFGLERMVARSSRIVECEMFGVKPCFTSVLSRYEAVTADRLAYVAKRDLPLDRRVVAEVTPVDLAPIAGVLRGTQRGTP